MKPQSLSIVLPVTLQEDVKAIDWRSAAAPAAEPAFQLLLRSFLKFFRMDELGTFLIVCPGTDKRIVRLMLKQITDDPRFEVVDELELLPRLTLLREQGHKIPGWYIQQLIKLSAANVLDSRFYLTLDSDIFCQSAFSVDNLIPAGKALLNIETPRSSLSLYRTEFSAREWKHKCVRFYGSAKLLGYRRKLSAWFHSYGETPVLMHTESVRNLLSFISERHGDWFECLTSQLNWTEYTLLFTYLEMTGGLEDFYQLADHNAVLNLEASAWRVSSEYRRARDYSPGVFPRTVDKGGPFVALQSYLPRNGWLPSEYPDINTYYRDLETVLLNNSKESSRH